MWVWYGVYVVVSAFAFGFAIGVCGLMQGWQGSFGFVLEFTRLSHWLLYLSLGFEFVCFVNGVCVTRFWFMCRTVTLGCV